MAIDWPTPGLKGRTFKLCVLTRWDFNFCVRSSPLLGRHSTPFLGQKQQQNPKIARNQLLQKFRDGDDMMHLTWFHQTNDDKLSLAGKFCPKLINEKMCWKKGWWLYQLSFFLLFFLFYLFIDFSAKFFSVDLCTNWNVKTQRKLSKIVILFQCVISNRSLRPIHFGPNQWFLTK